MTTVFLRSGLPLHLECSTWSDVAIIYSAPANWYPYQLCSLHTIQRAVWQTVKTATRLHTQALVQTTAKFCFPPTLVMPLTCTRSSRLPAGGVGHTIFSTLLTVSNAGSPSARLPWISPRTAPPAGLVMRATRLSLFCVLRAVQVLAEQLYKSKGSHVTMPSSWLASAWR